MKKTLFLITLLIIIFTGIISVNAQNIYYNDEYHSYDAGVIGLKINGKSIGNLPMAPVIINDYTMVPVREVFEALGSTVVWHDDTCRVEIKDRGVSVFVKIGDRNVYVGNQLSRIEEPMPLPMLIGYDPSLLKSMVPVRFVAEKLGYKVSWDDKARTVSISSKDEVPEKMPEEAGSFGSVTAESDDKYDYVYISTRYGISPKITRYTNPDRVVFDFPKAQFIQPGGSIQLDGNSVASVRYSNHEKMARVVLDITSSTQAFVMSSDRGIMIRAEKSPNDEIIYDAFSKRVYFNKAYVGSGKAIENGYKVNFTNLKLSSQKIAINDKSIYSINITATSSGCSITVDGSNKLSYTAEKGFYFKETVNTIPQAPPVNVNGKNVVVIDAGHGGKDPGAVGYNQNGQAVAYESHINLAIALLVGQKLENSGVSVVYTRKNDTYISLAERVDIANKANCKFFVSIHCNSINKADIDGTQVYYHPVSEVGTVLAKNIYDEIVETTGLAPKKVQNGSHLYVIRSTVSPAVLVETAFISNADDRNYLLSKKGQEELAESIYQGIVRTMK